MITLMMYQVRFLSLEKKEAIDDEIGSIIENNTWVLSDLPPGCKWIFKRKMKVDVIHQMDVKTTFLNGDLDEEVYMKQPEGFVMPGNKHKTALESNKRVFKYLRGTKSYGLSYVEYPSVLEGYSDASWTNHIEDSSFTSGWVFLLGGGAISWASNKQTCILSSTMETEFVALAVAGKEAEWLRN
nr:zinc finger, CCHC-type [Tanacetum cinerariifolium]